MNVKKFSALIATSTLLAGALTGIAGTAAHADVPPGTDNCLNALRYAQTDNQDATAADTAQQPFKAEASDKGTTNSLVTADTECLAQNETVTDNVVVATTNEALALAANVAGDASAALPYEQNVGYAIADALAAVPTQ